MRSSVIAGFVALVVFVVGGCSSNPKPTASEKGAVASPDAAALEAVPPDAGSPEGTAEPVVVAESPVASYLADPAALARGRGLFRSVCAGYCHSTQATDRVASNLFDCDWDHGSGDQDIFDIIAAGVPDTQMQGFGDKVPDEDLWKIIAWVRSSSKCTADPTGIADPA